jgi:type II secretory pathway component PulF
MTNMAMFEYSALTSAGRAMSGTIEAGSREEAAEQLKQMGLEASSIEKAKAARLSTPIGRNEFVLFNQQLASITKAGIPLERGLRELAKDIGSKPMRVLVEDIAGELESGVPIEEAFEKRQKRFPPLYGRILKAGIETGRLSEMLTSLNRHLELANQTRRIVFEAMAYPAVVLVLSAILITIIFTYIIPQFEPILSELGGEQQLPALTMVFLTMARNMVPFWTTVGLVIAGIVFLVSVLSTFPAGRRVKESVFLSIPVVGRVYYAGTLSRMAEAMAMMVSAGCTMPTCLRLSADSSGSERLIREGHALADQVEQGANILEAGRLCRMIPRLFLYSIQLGAQRNELQDNLYSLGQMYAEQARFGQARLQAVLLPAMVIAVGGFIAMCVMAMFLPMIRIVSSLSA